MSKGKPPRKRPSAAEVRRLLSYDPETGIITRKVAAGGLKAGAVAGYRRADGYVVLEVAGLQTYAHIVAWVIVRGRWPRREIDHRDLDRSNNRWVNLRPAKSSEQRANQRVRADSRTGIKGVIRRGNSWGAAIRVRGKQIWLGSFRTAAAASGAYASAARQHFGEYARVS